MYLRLSDDEQTVAEVFASFFENESDIETVRRAAPLGHDPNLWTALASTGAPGMAVAEAHGGGGASLADLAVVVTEWGRRLAPVPLVDHAVATRALVRAGAPSELVEPLVAGDQIATLAVRPGGRLVPAGAVADVVIGLDDGSFVATTTPPPGVAPRTTSDAPLADRDLSDGGRIELAGGEVAWRDAVTEWQALMAAALHGLAEEALRLGVDYVKERQQFGVAVGSFQALQHGLATSATAIEGLRFLAAKAIWSIDSGSDDAARLAPMAFLFAAETAQQAAATSLQYHGGYGFAEEYDIQMYYRRAKGWPQVLGDPGAEYQRLADLTLGGN